MPLFPNINTLVNKTVLSGQEVIQISATEKVTLKQIVEQLGFTPNSLLTGLEEITPGGLDTPVATDTLIQALAKLISLVGGDKLVILPTTPREYGGTGSRLVVLIDNSVVDGGTGGLVASVFLGSDSSQPRISIEYRVWETAEQHPLLTCNTIQDLDAWASSNSPTSVFNWGEKFVENSSNDLIEFNPGDVIFHTGTGIARIRIPIYYWNAQNILFSQNSALIITKVNVLRSMFNESSGGSFANIVYLFSEGFDEAPGTEYQCITIQKVRSSGGKAYLMVNKGGYAIYTPSA